MNLYLQPLCWRSKVNYTTSWAIFAILWWRRELNPYLWIFSPPHRPPLLLHQFCVLSGNRTHGGSFYFVRLKVWTVRQLRIWVHFAEMVRANWRPLVFQTNALTFWATTPFGCLMGFEPTLQEPQPCVLTINTINTILLFKEQKNPELVRLWVCKSTYFIRQYQSEPLLRLNLKCLCLNVYFILLFIFYFVNTCRLGWIWTIDPYIISVVLSPGWATNRLFCCDGGDRTHIVLSTHGISVVTKPFIHVTICTEGGIRTPVFNFPLRVSKV